MAEYELSFARKLAQIAQEVVDRGLADVDDHRVVAYNSRLSMELSLKAFLERAGLPISTIRALSHDLSRLLEEAGKCQVAVEIGGLKHWVSASRVRAVTVVVHGAPISVGMILEAEAHGASRYPAELRYGSTPKDFPAEALAAAAVAIANWVAEHADTARRAA